MKQQSVKNNLKSAISSKKIDPEYSFRQTDLSSSSGFKTIRRDSINENQNMENIVTGVGIFSKVEHTPHVQKKFQLQSSSLSSKDGPPSVHNIKQIKAAELRNVNASSSMISDDKETPSLTEVKAWDLIPLANKDAVRPYKPKMVKKLSKFTNFGIEKPTRKESDSTQRASGRKESGSSIKVKINPNEYVRSIVFSIDFFCGEL